jgi:hypothetical protein
MRSFIKNTLAGLAATAMATCLASVATGSAVLAAPRLGDGFYAITNFQTGQCLEPASGADGAPVVEAPCVVDPANVESISQGWQPISFGGTNHYQFKNQRTGFCFNAFDGAFNGGRLLVTACAPISNEQWNTARSVPSAAAVKIESRERFRDTGICLDLAANRVNTVLFQCNGSQTQAWYVR